VLIQFRQLLQPARDIRVAVRGAFDVDRVGRDDHEPAPALAGVLAKPKPWHQRRAGLTGKLDRPGWQGRLGVEELDRPATLPEVTIRHQPDHAPRAQLVHQGA
jgi:hypothetical protein